MPGYDPSRLPKTTITLRLTPATLGHIQQIARQANRSISYTIEVLLIHALNLGGKPAPDITLRKPPAAKRKA